MTYVYPLTLILGGVLFGLGLGFVAASGNQSSLKFATKEGGFLAIGGVIVALLALAFLRP
jgi:hypothetical protein